MRLELQKILGERMKFRGRVVEIYKINTFKDYYEWRMILESIVRVDTNREVADKLHIKISKTIKEANLRVNDLIEFDATVGECWEDFYYRQLNIDDRQLNYNLKRLNQIKILEDRRLNGKSLTIKKPLRR